jgi:hypothetical protein
MIYKYLIGKKITLSDSLTLIISYSFHPTRFSYPQAILQFNYYGFLFRKYKIDNEFNIECQTSKRKHTQHTFTVHKKQIK